MKNIKITLLSLILIFATAVSFAQSGGSTALSFLRMDMGARYFGMAGAGTAFADDITGMSFYNPAALGRIKSFQLAGNTYKAELDMKYYYGGFGIPVPLSIAGNNPMNIGASVYVFDKGEMEDGGFNRNVGKDWVFTLGLAEHLGTSTIDGFSGSSSIEHYLGLNAKYIRSTLPNVESGSVDGQTFAFDIGYTAVLDGIVGLAISGKNFGKAIKYIDESDSLPSTISGGIFYKPIRIEYLDLTVSADYIHYLKDDDNRVRLGTEILLFDILAARGGVKFLEELGSEYTIGFGLRLFGFEADFGMVLNPQMQSKDSHKKFQASIAYKFPVEAQSKKHYSADRNRDDYKRYKQQRTENARNRAAINKNPILYQ